MIHGYTVHGAGAELHAWKYEPGELGPGDVEIAVSHCGVSQTDIKLIDNDLGTSKFPFIPGHEIVGTVAALGPQAKGLREGQRVGIGWQSDSCGHCPWCRTGEEQLCMEAQPTCVGRNGGFAERIRVDARFAVPIPDGMNPAATAPLLSAGITVYSPLRAYGTHPASRVGVIGIGGLGHLALQFARAFGAEVTAFSSSAAKEDDAKRFGAHHFVNTRESKTRKGRAGHFDLILTTGSADTDWPAYLAALRPRGALVFAGVPTKPIPVSAAALTTADKTVAGTNTGSPARIAEMLEVAARHRIEAAVEQFPMREANAAVERVRKGTARYRAVLAN